MFKKIVTQFVENFTGLKIFRQQLESWQQSRA